MVRMMEATERACGVEALDEAMVLEAYDWDRSDSRGAYTTMIQIIILIPRLRNAPRSLTNVIRLSSLKRHDLVERSVLDVCAVFPSIMTLMMEADDTLTRDAALDEAMLLELVRRMGGGLKAGSGGQLIAFMIFSTTSSNPPGAW
jgi:hypothetical protein